VAEYVSKTGRNGPVAGTRNNRKNNAKEIKHGKGKIPDQIGMP
jgi:hypothetical protein